MKNKKSSTDGFIPRRSGDQLGDLHSDTKREVFSSELEYRPLHTGGNDSLRPIGEPQPGRALGRSDIDDSLKDIDNLNEKPAKKLSRRQRRRLAGQVKRPRSLTKRITRWVVVIIILTVLTVGGYMAYKFYNTGSSIFQGNFLDIFKNEPLKQDINGRSNFLILGTSEDDPGHDGAGLTDSMLVVSIDQTNKNVYMFSVPRDLYVKYGTACPAGYSGKINAYFTCVNDGTTVEAEQDRLTQTQKLVGDIFGLDIQYGIHVNHTVIKEAVDAVGGVDVDIQGSNGDPGVFDRNFDWRCQYNCYLVKYENGIHHLDGEHALFLSMARGDVAPTYGLGNSNFDREKNQQKILMALKDKAMTTGTLTNLTAITALMDTLSANLRTNIQNAEIRTIAQVASEIKSADVYTLSLVGDNSVVVSGNYYGASVVMPAAGMYEYSEIQDFIKKNITSDPVIKESAPIVVLNGTGQSGFGQTKADALTATGYTVASVGNAPEGIYDSVEIYQIGTDNNAATAAKLTKTYNVTIKTTEPPVTVDATVKFVIIFGSTS